MHSGVPDVVVGPEAVVGEVVDAATVDVVVPGPTVGATVVDGTDLGCELLLHAAAPTGRSTAPTIATPRRK